MLAAETLLEILSGATDELRGLATYESRCRHAFALSFGCGKVWREIVSRWAECAGEKRRMNSTASRDMVECLFEIGKKLAAK